MTSHSILLALTLVVGSPATADGARVPDLEPLERFGDDLGARLQRQIETIQRLDGADASVAERAAAHARLGMLLHLYEYYDQADLCYRNAAALEPDNPRWSYDLGLVAADDARYSAAVEHFQRARALRPHDLPTLLHLGTALLRLSRPTAAATVFDEALALDPSSAAAHCGAGQLAVDAGDWQRAAPELERCLELQPSALRVHGQLSLVYNKLGDHELAARHAALYGSTEVSFPDPERARILALMDTGELRLQAAIQAFNEQRLDRAAPLVAEVLRGDPDNVEALRMQAAIQSNGGDLEASLATYLRVVALDPGDADAQIRSAGLLEELERPDEAAVHYRAALRLDPSNRDVAVATLRAMTAAGQDRELASLYPEIVRRWPQETSFRVAWAATFYRLGELADAEREARRAVDEGATFDDAFLLLAAVQLARGRNDDAGSTLEEGLRRNPDSLRLQQSLSRLRSPAAGAGDGDSP